MPDQFEILSPFSNSLIETREEIPDCRSDEKSLWIKCRRSGTYTPHANFWRSRHPRSDTPEHDVDNTRTRRVRMPAALKIARADTSGAWSVAKGNITLLTVFVCELEVGVRNE
ncbi:hypothetical protein BaRGS_00013224 [Batillaria attramentaria]|uniref:Uncharacterized protein n=1 Tax=Batillaria attramentaria TaxID=370345 RepID=A0ABD0L8C2_9CAEN